MWLLKLLYKSLFREIHSLEKDFSLCLVNKLWALYDNITEKFENLEVVSLAARRSDLAARLGGGLNFVFQYVLWVSCVLHVDLFWMLIKPKGSLVP